MSDDMEKAEDKKGGAGGGLLILGLVALLLLVFPKKTTTPEVTEAADGAGGGGNGGGGNGGTIISEPIVEAPPVEVVAPVIETPPAQIVTPVVITPANGSGSAPSPTPIQQVQQQRLQDPQWQTQRSRVNIAVVTPNVKKLIEKGAVTKETLKSIADYQAVRSGRMSATEYGGAPSGYNPEAINAAGTAYQTSPTTVRNRALAYYSGQTGAHRGAMSAEQRTAWDSANLNNALNAYANASGSGNQSDVARSIAVNTPGGSMSSTPATSVTKTPSKSTGKTSSKTGKKSSKK